MVCDNIGLVWRKIYIPHFFNIRIHPSHGSGCVNCLYRYHVLHSFVMRHTASFCLIKFRMQ